MSDSIDPDRLPDATAQLRADRATEQSGPAPEKHRGPAVLRRGQVQAGTTDQRLLDTRGPSDWVHTDPWRVLRIQAEFVEGFGLLAELPAAGAGFWSGRTPRGHPGDGAAPPLARGPAPTRLALL